MGLRLHSSLHRTDSHALSRDKSELNDNVIVTKDDDVPKFGDNWHCCGA